jgi:hypothetical protein
MHYTEWNQKLLEYLTAGLPLGARLYLTIDDEALRTIGGLAGIAEGAVEDFETAIRDHCTFRGCVNLNHLSPDTTQRSDDAPPYLAFLCAMALAAHRMGDNARPNNFFVHFNRILCLSTEGRPCGLEGELEEILWSYWADWLRERGYTPTAQKHGSRYIDYAISQALLRQTDRNNLWRYFNLLPRQLSEDELLARLQRDAQNNAPTLTEHLKILLNAQDERYESVLEAVRELYEAWALTEPSERQRTASVAMRSTLSAGLYRREDFFTGAVDYLIFPYQPRHLRLEGAYVNRNGKQALIEERRGYFEPLWDAPISLAELENGARYPIQGGGSYRQLNLPKRAFWLLTRDDEGTNIFATWRKHPELGAPFILLGRADLEKELETFEAKDMLTYTKRDLQNLSGWCEYHLTLTSDIAAWKEAEGDQALIQALRPRQNLTLALSSGLADPRSGAWLTNALPQVVIYALEPEAQLSIQQAQHVIHQLTLQTGKPHSLPDLRAGIYDLVVTCGGLESRRSLRINDWSALTPAPLPQTLTEQSLFSAWLLESEDDETS